MFKVSVKDKKQFKKALLFYSNNMFDKSLEVLQDVKKTRANLCALNLIRSRIYQGKNELIRAQLILLEDFKIYDYEEKIIALNELCDYPGSEACKMFVLDKCFSEKFDLNVAKMVIAKANQDQDNCLDAVCEILLHLISNKYEDQCLELLIKFLISNSWVEKSTKLMKVQKLMKKILLMQLNKSSSCDNSEDDLNNSIEMKALTKFCNKMRTDLNLAINEFKANISENELDFKFDIYWNLLKEKVLSNDLNEEVIADHNFSKEDEVLFKAKKASEVSKVNSAKDAFKMLNKLFMNIEEVVNNSASDAVLKSEIINKVDFIRDKFAENEIKICMVGETGTGKTTFLNTMFETDLFFTTQEEATGVPTEIRWGKNIAVEVIDKSGKIKSFYEIKEDKCYENGELTSNSPAQFILKHTKVNEEALRWVDHVNVRLPIDNLPKELVIIDTPGFNANIKRTEIAKKSIMEAHVCIFLIDARNALKKREMDVLDIVRNEAGKTFFVLNKMDLIDADDDLDCDGDEVIDELLKRVEDDINNYFKISNAMVHAVSCVKSSDSEMEQFFNNMKALKKTIFNEAVSQKLDLIIDMAAKQVINYSPKLNLVLDEEIEKCRREKVNLMKNLPEDFNVFKDEIIDKILKQYYESKDKYIDELNRIIYEQLKNANDGFYLWLNSVESKATLKDRCMDTAQKNMNYALEIIQKERSQMMDDLAGHVMDYVRNLLESLYADLNLNRDEANDNLMKEYDDVKADLNNNVYQAVLSVQSSSELKHFFGFLGAGVGIILGPIGAVCGGILGASLFEQSLYDMKVEISEAYDKAWNETYENVLQSCNNDLNEEDDNKFFASMLQVIKNEIDLYESTVKCEIEKCVHNYKMVKKRIQENKVKQLFIENSISELTAWRKHRRNN